MSFYTAQVTLDWLPLEKGGRQSVPMGPTYAATAYVAGDGLAKLFSVVIRFVDPIVPERRMGYRAEVQLLSPATVEKKFTPGHSLVITEGAQPVAQCTVLSVQAEHAA